MRREQLEEANRNVGSYPLWRVVRASRSSPQRSWSRWLRLSSDSNLEASSGTSSTGSGAPPPGCAARHRPRRGAQGIDRPAPSPNRRCPRGTKTQMPQAASTPNIDKASDLASTGRWPAAILVPMPSGSASQPSSIGGLMVSRPRHHLSSAVRDLWGAQSRAPSQREKSSPPLRRSFGG